MASSTKPSRYSYYDSRSSSTSSHFSDPSSSSEFKKSRAIVKSKASDPSRGKYGSDGQNLTSMMKKLMEKKSGVLPLKSKGRELVIPADLIAEDLKKNVRKGSNFTALRQKLFGKGTEKEKEKVKALTEVKANTRTLAMVLRSERELLSANKEQEMEIAELKLMFEEKNREIEKLKDLCLKQREEIKALKSAVLFPDGMDYQLKGLLEKQGSELGLAKQVIPTLQKQVTSLTGQLRGLEEALAEVKADKYTARAFSQCHGSSPRTPTYDRGEASDSLEFSSGDPATPGTPDDMFLEDLNPCLTPYCAKTKSPESKVMAYESLHDEMFSENNMQITQDIDFTSLGGKLSKSSDCYRSCKRENVTVRTARRSDESKCTYRKPMRHKNF